MNTYLCYSLCTFYPVLLGVTFHRYGLGGFDGDLPVDTATKTYTDKSLGTDNSTSSTIAIKTLQTIIEVSATPAARATLFKVMF